MAMHGNPAGFKPLNPWGRGFPKPPRPIQDERTPMYQLQVDWGPRLGVPIGPIMVKQAVEDFCEVVNKMIILGKEREWTNPRVVLTRS